MKLLNRNVEHEYIPNIITNFHYFYQEMTFETICVPHINMIDIHCNKMQGKMFLAGIRIKLNDFLFIILLILCDKQIWGVLSMFTIPFGNTNLNLVSILIICCLLVQK